MIQLSVGNFDGVVAHFRPNSSDENALIEVIEKRCYRRARLGFDVEAGETWLDLGANIGAFTLYALKRGASFVMALEPDPDCFDILTQNVKDFLEAKRLAERSLTSEIRSQAELRNFAISDKPTGLIPFWTSRKEGDFYRSTIFEKRGMKPHPAGTLKNQNGSLLPHIIVDGVKMDIEGAEMGLLDNGWIPQCQKLVMEYHSSRDADTDALGRRLEFLKSRFKVVNYPPELDRVVAQGFGITPTALTYYDRSIFCMEPR